MDTRTLDIAWAAGFFDGEGMIGIKINKGSALGFIRVGQNNPTPLDALKDLFGGYIEDAHTGRANRHFRWTATHKAARSALLEMLPYLRTRGHDAIRFTSATTQSELLALRGSFSHNSQIRTGPTNP